MASSNYWALVSNPNVFNIVESIDNCDEDWWTTKGKGLKPGDYVVIWKAKGSDHDAGIIAFGRAIKGPEIREEYGNPYWIDKSGAGPQERILIEYERKFKPLLWKANYTNVSWFNELNFVRAHGGTVFKLTEREWNKLKNEDRGNLYQPRRIHISIPESEAHKKLKNFVANNPAAIGINRESIADIEHRFISGDQVDVMFSLPNLSYIVVEIELEGEFNTRIGAFQAAKYRTLAKMEKKTQNVLAFLVAYEIPKSTKEFCENYNIKCMEIDKDSI